MSLAACIIRCPCTTRSPCCRYRLLRRFASRTDAVASLTCRKRGSCASRPSAADRCLELQGLAPTSRAREWNRQPDLQELGEVFTFRHGLGKRGLAGGLPTG